MSEASIVIVIGAFLTALPATLLAFAALRKGNQNGAGIEDAKKGIAESAQAIVATKTVIEATKLELTDNTRKTEDSAKELVKIHALTNSTAQRLENDLKNARDEIRGLLEAELAKAREEIAALRRYVVPAKDQSALLVQTGTTPADASLKRIDMHTEQIEKNTASTEAKVDDLKSEDHR